MPTNSYRPEAVELGRFAPPAPVNRTADALYSNAARLVLCALRPAAAVEVLCSGGHPQFVRGEQIHARVISYAGPWRRTGGWWSEHPFARDYYELALANSGVYRAFRELNSERWYIVRACTQTRMHAISQIRIPSGTSRPAFKHENRNTSG